MRPRPKEMHVVVGTGEGNEEGPGIEWSPCLTELFDALQNPLRITSLVLSPYPREVQAARGLINEPVYVLSVI